MVVLIATGCGGGGSAVSDPLLANEISPTLQGITGGNTEVFLPQSGWAEDSVPGASSEAPLGLNMAYNPQSAGVETVRSSSRTVSELASGQDFDILAGTISLFGADPNWEAQNLNFTEGQLITLWVQYQSSGQAPLSINWQSAETNIDYTVPFINASEAGVYATSFDITVPVGSAGDAEYTFTLDYGKLTSVLVGPGDLEAESIRVPFTITAITPNIEVEYEPPSETPPGDYPSCWSHISVIFSEDHFSVTTSSDKELGNVVLQFEDWSTQMFDDLDQNPRYVDTFSGTGQYSGRRLRGVWVKSGCNASSDGSGFGEYFAHNITGYSLMVWEDLIQNSDYDYNDFVCSMHIKETRNSENELIEINLLVKALARGAGYDHDWQFNIDSAFPDATCVATIDQYYAGGTRHGNQRIWYSSQGVSVPVFVSSKQALPAPAGYWATNAFDNQPVVDGDYAVVKIQFDKPIPQGNYVGMPYAPELRVKPGSGNVYVVPMWTKPGDYLDSNGRPLAFIVPNTFVWPAENVKLWDVYPEFSNWVNWIGNPVGNTPDRLFWNYAPVGNFFDQASMLINSVEGISLQ